VVAGLCRRLDGLPLAIELAAARVRALPPAELAARLGDRFRLRGGGGRAVDPRQQTLRATIDWSWELLAEPQRRLWRRLSVFSGGWTVAAAEVVCGGPAWPRPRSWRGWLGWSTGPWSWPPAATRPVLGCWRRCGPMGLSGWLRPARPRRWPPATPAGAWTWPRRPPPTARPAVAAAGGGRL